MTSASLLISADICACILISHLDVLGIKVQCKIKSELSLLSVEHSCEKFVTDGFI